MEALAEHEMTALVLGNHIRIPILPNNVILKYEKIGSVPSALLQASIRSILKFDLETVHRTLKPMQLANFEMQMSSSSMMRIINYSCNSHCFLVEVRRVNNLVVVQGRKNYFAQVLCKR
jgi:hypothetical protein